MFKVYANKAKEYPISLSINFAQLEKEICSKASKSNLFLSHNQQVVCIAENDKMYKYVYVTCYAASPEGKQKLIAVYTLEKT